MKKSALYDSHADSWNAGELSEVMREEKFTKSLPPKQNLLVALEQQHKSGSSKRSAGSLRINGTVDTPIQTRIPWYRRIFTPPSQKFYHTYWRKYDWKEWTMRVILGIVIVSIIFLFKIFGVVNFNIDHIHDLVQEWTGPINRELNRNPSLAHAIEIIASLMMDFSFLSLCVYWAAFGKNSIPIMASGNFYITRAILQLLFRMPKPDGLYWPYPGFPSIVVPYGSSSDFFYSGHVGFLTILSLQWFKFWNQSDKTSKVAFGMFWFAIVSTVIMAFTMIIFRTHFIIGNQILSLDVVSGVVFAHYFYMIAQKTDGPIDNLALRVFQCVCYRNKQKKKKNMLLLEQEDSPVEEIVEQDFDQKRFK